jgi:hypothetical protein
MGFSAEWLALREPADRAARDAGLARRACAGQPEAPVVIDLGAGTGATRRALAGHLPPATEWVLIDNDRALLEAAASGAGAEVRTVAADLRDVEALPLERATLVTASALLDLVSREWLAALVARLRAQRVPFYAALSYDGRMDWQPESRHDQDVVAAFNRNQRRTRAWARRWGRTGRARPRGCWRRRGSTWRSPTAPGAWTRRRRICSAT